MPQPPTPVIRPMSKKNQLTTAETMVAQGVFEKVDQIQKCLEHLMALPPTELAVGVQMHLRETQIITVVQDLRKDIQEQLGDREQQLGDRSRVPPLPTQSTTFRLRNAMALRKRMMGRLVQRQEPQGNDNSPDSRPSKRLMVLPLLKKALRAQKLDQQQPSPKPPSDSPLLQAESSVCSFTAPSNACDASAAGGSANGKGSRNRRSPDSSQSAPTAPGPPPPAKSKESERSALGSSAPTLSFTGRNTPTLT